MPKMKTAYTRIPEAPVENSPSGGSVPSELIPIPDPDLDLEQPQPGFDASCDKEDKADLVENPRWVYVRPPGSGLCRILLTPFYRFLAWLRLLCDNYDGHFIAILVFGEHLLKGFVAGGGGGGLLIVESYIYMKLEIGAARKSILTAASRSAWAIKPIYGAISDSFTVFGYQRTPWIIMLALFASTGWISLFIMKEAIPAIYACVCFFMIKVQVSWTDLIMESVYTKKIRENPKYGADIISWVWTGIGIFSIFAVIISGPGVQYFGPFNLSVVGIIVALAIIVPTCMGWLTETKLPVSERGFQKALFKKQKNFYLVTLVLALSVLVSMGVSMSKINHNLQAGIAVLCSALSCLSIMIWLPSGLSKPMLFMFLASATSIDTSGFVDNFYLDPATKAESEKSGFPVCENCPHFSATFYYTVIGIFDSLFMAFASWAFNAYMSKWTYRKALVTTQIVACIVSLVDIIQFQRWNTEVGIPDWIFMLGKAAVQNTVGMLNFMPTTILISHLCPKGIEAITFALVAGFSNFGSTISGYLGAWVLEMLDMDTIGSGETDDFGNAWKASLINSVSPMFVLFLLPMLIPDKKMTESLDIEMDDHHVG